MNHLLLQAALLLAGLSNAVPAQAISGETDIEAPVLAPARAPRDLPAPLPSQGRELEKSRSAWLPSPATVREVNRRVNTATRYVSDEKLYGRREFWTVARGAGDCEDYALAKRALLMASGVDPAHLRLMSAWIGNGEYHLVLVVRTTAGDYVLDARHPEPMSRQALEALGYRWHLIEEDGRWFAVR